MYRSQFMPQADPVGTIKFFTPTSTSFMQGDREWLKTGFAKDKTNYTEAAATPPCQVVGIYGDKYISSSAPEIAACATDGNGTIIIAAGTGTLRMSTDYGVTWGATATVGVPAVTGIAYTGTTWIIVGNAASTIYIQTSTNPSSAWNALQSISYAPGNASADTASVCWDSVNSKYVVVFSSAAATEASLYSSTGAAGSWTKVNLANALSGKTSIAAYNGVVIAGCFSNGTGQRSTNAGTSWSFVNTNGFGNIVVASGKFFRLVSASSIVYSSDATTWTTSTSVPDVGFAYNTNMTLASDGTTVFFCANQAKYIGYTTDGITFTVKPAAWGANYGITIASMGVNKIFCVDNGGVISKTLRSVNVNTCDYVGTSTTFYNLGTTYQNGYLIGYVRIK